MLFSPSFLSKENAMCQFTLDFDDGHDLHHHGNDYDDDGVNCERN